MLRENLQDTHLKRQIIRVICVIRGKIFPTKSMINNFLSRTGARAALLLGGLVLLLAYAAMAQTVPAPKDVLGWTPGEDRKLASWAEVVDYFKKLDAASDRVQFQEIGKTTMGAPFVYAEISSNFPGPRD